MSSDSISAVYLQGLNYENELNILLKPPNELRGDIRQLAGSLGFEPDEIFCKDYPFLYLLDVWIRKEGAETATLQILHSKLTNELERPDAAQIVENAIDYLKELSPRQLAMIADRYNCKLKRSNSTYSLCQSFKQNVNDLEDSSNATEETYVAPSVYIVCSAAESKCLKQIKEIVNKLRTLGINAKADIIDTKYNENQRYSIYRNLLDTEQVLFLCSPFSNLNESYREQAEDTRKANFIMKFLNDFLFEKGPYKSKYIPVLLPGATFKDVPLVLSGLTSYNMNDTDFYKKLQYAIFKVEQFELSPVKKGFKFKPRII